MRHPFRGAASRLTIMFGLAVSLAAELPAQQYWQYGPFRITAGRWHSIGLFLRKGEYFQVVASGTMTYHNSQQFGPGGYQLPNGNIAGRLYALSGENSVAVGASGAGNAGVDGNLELGVLFNPNVNESEAVATKGAFYVWVTAPAQRCSTLTCGFTNAGADISQPTPVPGPGNVSTWSPHMQSILVAGYQLGNAEIGAMYGGATDAAVRYVDDRLRMAQTSAVGGPLDTRAIAALITNLAQARSASAIASQITSVSDSYQQAMSRSCTCGGVPVNPAWVFNAGRNLAYAEAATYQNWDASTMYTSLNNLRVACINSAILPVSAIDGVMQMLRGGWQPSQLPATNKNAPRNEIIYAADKRCVCY
jgi:hypothetical protein